MGQCATVTISKAAVEPSSSSISMLNGQEEDEEEDEEDEEEDPCQGCLCEGCKCCKGIVACLTKIGLCLL